MTETELKYTIPSQLCAERMLDDSYFKMIADAADWEAIPMKAVYYDTDDNLLRQKGLAFRIRSEGNNHAATVKFSGEVVDGLHCREEINIYFDREAAGENVDLTAFLQYESFRKLEIDPKEIHLTPFMETDFMRYCLEVCRCNCHMELALDIGSVSSGGKKVEVRELEIEIKGGKDAQEFEDLPDMGEGAQQGLAPLLEIGEEIRKRYGLLPEAETKYSRGIKLAAGK